MPILGHGLLTYAIDVITHITNCETDGGWKFGYAAILSGKNDSGSGDVGQALRSTSKKLHSILRYAESLRGLNK